MANTITVKIRDIELTADITNADGMFFLSLVYNEEERELVKEGRLEEAATRYGNRQKKRLNKAKSEQQRQSMSEEMDKEMTIAVFQLIETDKKVRSQVAWRLIEIFPAMPENLVYYHDELKNGIRLDAEETMSLFLNVIAPSLTDLASKENPIKEINKLSEEPAVIKSPKMMTSELWQEEEEESLLAQRKARLAQLKAEIEVLESV
jgi:hypothetical protein